VPVDVADRPEATPLDAECDGSVEFDDVTFGYEPGRPVLRHVSFRVEPGETVALVGPTGSGKTSSTALAHRFYDVWEGRVLVGGRDVRDVTLDSLGRAMAMVLQEPHLFSSTVADFVERLPRGYDTELDQRASNLSLGQRQLLAFARALVADTRILVLDEATANVDSHTEHEIQRALATLLAGRTAIVIAHRLATVRNADRILVLDAGEIVERGTHEGLMRRGGLYARLCRMNYASFDDMAVEEADGAPAPGARAT